MTDASPPASADRPTARIDSIAALDAYLQSQTRPPALVTAFEPALRREIIARLRDEGITPQSALPAGNWIARGARFGEGVIVFGPICLMPNTDLGSYVIVHRETSIGHDVTVGDYVSIGERACVSGHVTIGAGTVIESGAVAVNGTAARPLQIGRDARILAGAVVTKNVPDGATVGGNPAKRIRP